MAIDAPEPIAARVGLAHLLVKNFGAYGAHALSGSTLFVAIARIVSGSFSARARRRKGGLLRRGRDTSSAMIIQELVDTTFRAMAASGLQPISPANFDADVHCYVRCARGGMLGLETCTSTCADSIRSNAAVQQLNRNHSLAQSVKSLPCWFLHSPSVPGVCSEKLAAEGTQLLSRYTQTAPTQEQSAETWTQPVVFFGDSLSHGMYDAATCAAAHAGIQVVGGTHLTLARANSRLTRNSSKVGVHAARERLGLMNPGLRSAVHRMTKDGGGTVFACIGMHYNNDASTWLVTKTHRNLKPAAMNGAHVRLPAPLPPLSREDFKADVPAGSSNEADLSANPHSHSHPYPHQKPRTLTLTRSPSSSSFYQTSRPAASAAAQR